MKNCFFIVLIVVIVIVISITAGTLLYNNLIRNAIKDKENSNSIEIEYNKIDNTVNNDVVDVIETSSNDNKVAPNCIFIFKTYYPKCEHIKVKKEKVKETMVNKTREDLEKIYKNWKVVTFRSDEVLFYREEEGMCNEHYLIKELDDSIAIYTIDENNNESLFETTSILTSYLPNEDRIKLKEGIKVEGNNNLNKALEDFE